MTRNANASRPADPAIVSALVAKAAELGFDSFIFVGTPPNMAPSDTLLHIQRMPFDPGFNAALNVLRRLVENYLSQTLKTRPKDYGDAFDDFLVDVDAAVLELANKVRRLDRAQPPASGKVKGKDKSR